MKKTLIAALVLSAACSFAQTPAAPAAPNAPIEPPVPQNSDLDAVTFYNILRAELFNFEGDVGSAFRIYLNLARKNPSDQLFARAARLPLDARDGDTARVVSNEWAKAMPESALAQHYLFQINFAQGQYPNIVTPMREYLRLTPESDRPAAILGLTRYFSRIEQKQASANELTKALAPYIASAASSSATKAAARITSARALLDATRFNESLEQLKALTTETPDAIDGWAV
jgi:predicted Zn-dependent protease